MINHLTRLAIWLLKETCSDLLTKSQKSSLLIEYFNIFARRSYTDFSASNTSIRQYLHFDPPLDVRKIWKTVINPTYIVHHKFYPHIRQPHTTLHYKPEDHKIKKKPRNIYIASHLDACIYSWYATLLNARYEEYIAGTDINKCVTAYRPLGKSNIEFAQEVFDYIEKFNDCVVLAFDIKDFFDSLDHHIVKNMWEMLLYLPELPEDHYKIYDNVAHFQFVEEKFINGVFNIKKRRRKYGYIQRICTDEEFRNKLQHTGRVQKNRSLCGIPQGNPISAILSNIYMIDFDKKICGELKQKNGLYRRYSDDIIVICKPEHSEWIQNFVKEHIQKLKLKINDGKTAEIRFTRRKDGILEAKSMRDKHNYLQYLGFEFDGKRRFIRPASLSKFQRRMKKRVQAVAQKNRKIILIDGKYKKRSLYRKNTHIGNKNFTNYVYSAAKINNSIEIKKQISTHVNQLKKEIEKREETVRKKYSIH